MNNTRFKDLPEDTKQRLITLKNFSKITEVKTLNKEKIKTHTETLLNINALEKSRIKEDLNIIAAYLQDIEKADTEEIIKNMECKSNEVQNSMDFYEHAINAPVFFEELKEVYEILCGRFLLYKCKKGGSHWLNKIL